MKIKCLKCRKFLFFLVSASIIGLSFSVIYKFVHNKSISNDDFLSNKQEHLVDEERIIKLINLGEIDAAKRFLREGKLQRDLLIVLLANEPNLDMLKYVNSLGWDLNILYDDKISPLYAICSSTFDDGAIAKMLPDVLLMGVDPNIDFGLEASSVNLCAMNNKIKSLKVLLMNGAKFDFEEDQGVTPLMLASQYGSVDCVELLVDSGANPLARDNDGKTAFDYLEMEWEPTNLDRESMGDDMIDFFREEHKLPSDIKLRITKILKGEGK
ncbi:ankyrin repeat domain-containing protein [Verrucomicrobiaceae bacterium R5-34]|uniref:Ankyrin repeat domain-containing protein n=1 Tax=Oceaniferula flava TaxID=2800421 RepID=A0AAE2V9C6_9BACT|nr:ankyrin repeat domain-containing protein [Oceaniferula flavus]MBK1832238.1 ankyrin repeat domain-containing protein [Verrucomicrobiaceae bacterium R5-34]MBK1854878.1 ankyrin repeat domain-containing protein [Oceaniferula flavus]MBM1136184.1 ankyrin repeat domain-containing protein [Oceaniferula flavus]